MKRLTALMTAVVLVVGTAAVFGQAPPNFAGKWTLDPASVAAPPAGGPGGGGRGGGRGGGLGQELTIAQTASTLTLDYVGGRNPGPVKMTYNLDGSESKNTGMGGNEQVSKAVWEGSKLVVTTTLNFGGNSFEQKRAFSLEGGNLIVETTSQGGGGGAGMTSRLVYKKAS